MPTPIFEPSEVTECKRTLSPWPNVFPWVAVVVALLLTAVRLHLQGRVGWCSCGTGSWWEGDIWSLHNSQHVFDPYSFTHVLHGVIFCGIVSWLFPRVSSAWKLSGVIVLEALWELLENSQYVIQRYREATIGLGYEGDSITNSFGDILCCAIGFLLARKLGFRLSVVLFVATELVLLVWIRDNLTLNVWMLLWPVDAIKAWQMVH